MPHSAYMTSELKRENNASISQAVVFTQKNSERQIHINLFYFLYIISLKNHLATDCKKIENKKRFKIPDTCIVRYYLRFYTGQRAKIPDCPVKYRTPGNPNIHVAGLIWIQGGEISMEPSTKG